MTDHSQDIENYLQSRNEQIDPVIRDLYKAGLINSITALSDTETIVTFAFNRLFRRPIFACIDYRRSDNTAVVMRRHDITELSFLIDGWLIVRTDGGEHAVPDGGIDALFYGDSPRAQTRYLSYGISQEYDIRLNDLFSGNAFKFPVLCGYRSREAVTAMINRRGPLPFALEPGAVDHSSYTGMEPAIFRKFTPDDRISHAIELPLKQSMFRTGVIPAYTE